MKKRLLFVFGLFIVLGGVYAFIAYKKSSREQPLNLPPIGIDPNCITPQFVDDKENEGVPLPPDLKKAKEAVANRIGSTLQGVTLRAITPTTILGTAGTNSGGNDFIFDAYYSKSHYYIKWGSTFSKNKQHHYIY